MCTATNPHVVILVLELEDRSSFPVPDRCTWYHYCLTPISIGAHILDIPLSIIATPIGWLAYPEEESK